MSRLTLLSIVLVGSLCSVAYAQKTNFLVGLDPYSPQQRVEGVIRIQGNNYAAGLMQLWQDAFRKRHPRIQFNTSLKGTETAMAAVYSGMADLGILGRESYSIEESAFEEWLGYKPLGIEITTGSLDKPHKTFAVMFFVHRSNPLQQLTKSQVTRILGCSGMHKDSIRTWGQLGLTGEWEKRPIHVYGYGSDSGFGRFLQSLFLQGKPIWNSEIKTFYNAKMADGSEIDSGKLILDALAVDPYGLAYSNVAYSNAGVKILAVAPNESGPFFKPTLENVWKRSYPITRFTTLFVNRVPGKPVDPVVKEFLRYILSRDGQEMVLREGSYLPLTSEMARIQLRKLE